MDRNVNEAVRHLMAMPDEVVSAKHIAPILRMDPGVIVKRVKEGTWDAERLGNYVISGERVKFFRQDFLQKCGFMEPDQQEKTVSQLLAEILEELKEHNRILMATLSFGQVVRYEEMYQKSTGAATPML